MHTLYDISSSKRFAPILGHFVFGIHFIFSIYFVFEKAVYADSANFIFHIVNQEDFFIAAYRYGCMPPQLIPLLAVKLGASLKIILFCYSLSYILFYYLVFNLVVYVLKNAEAGLVIALSLVLCIRHNYFMNHCEMHAAIVYAITLYAFIEYYYQVQSINKVIYVVITSALITLCLFSHPAILLAVMFILAYEMVVWEKFKDVKFYIIGSIVMLLIVGKTLFTQSDSYEGNLIGQLTDFKTFLPNFFELYSVEYIGSRFKNLYAIVSGIMMVLLYWYLQKKEYLKLATVLCCMVFFLLVSIVVYHAGDADMMMERAYSMIVIFIMIPFMKDFYSNQKKFLVINILSVVIVAWCFVGIFKTGKYYSNRVEYVNALIKENREAGNRKVIIPEKKMPPDVVLVTWAFSFETLLYSSLDGPENSVTIYASNEHFKISDDLSNKTLFLATIFDSGGAIDGLNKKYFQLPEKVYIEKP